MSKILNINPAERGYSSCTGPGNNSHTHTHLHSLTHTYTWNPLHITHTHSHTAFNVFHAQRSTAHMLTCKHTHTSTSKHTCFHPHAPIHPHPPTYCLKHMRTYYPSKKYLLFQVDSESQTIGLSHLIRSWCECQ